MSDNSETSPEIPNRRNAKEFTFNEIELRDLLFNQSSRDQTFLRKYFDPRRDIDNECGYPGLGESPDITGYKDFYDTHCVATRVCEIYPLETWQVQPSIFEDDDPNVQTEFEKAWDELGAGLRGKSYHKNEEGSPIWDYLMNADILSGIGSFGIILLGFDDGEQLNVPVAMLSDEDEDSEDEKTWSTEDDSESTDETSDTVPVNNAGSIDAQYTGGASFAPDVIPTLKEGTKRKLIYMRAFDESLVQITRLELDRTSPRYGQPLMYRVTLIDPQLAKSQSISMDLSCPEVHWSRVIHIAETKGSNSEVFGIPRQQQVWRQLLNLYKMYGGAPEMYWRGALNGLSFETHPQLGGDVNIDSDSLKSQIENYRNSLQRDISTVGMTVKSLAPTVVDPTPNIEIQIQAICIKLACPQRIFMGSERGELASSQDDSSWNDRLKHRQMTYVTPRVIIPFVDRMISTGVLPKPSNNVVGQTGDANPESNKPTEGDTEPLDQTKPPTANAFPPKTAPNAPKSPASGQNGAKPASGQPSVTSDSGASGGDNTGTGATAAPTAKKRILPEKEDSPGYCVVWPDLDSMTDVQKAAIGLQRTQALMAFIAGNGESAMSLVDFYTKILYLTDEEAIAVIEATNAAIEADERMTPDPEDARQEEMEMQGEQFDKELEAKKELAEQGHGFGMEMQESQQGFQEKIADKTLKAKAKEKKPTANFNPSQPRDNGGRWSSGSGKSYTFGQVIPANEATDLIAEIRGGNVFSKNKGKLSAEPDVGELVVSRYPLNDLDQDQISLLRESTDPARVQHYVSQPIDTPVYLGVSRKRGNTFVNDGGHRILAAIDRGDTEINALVPKKLHDKFYAKPTTNNRVMDIIAKFIGMKYVQNFNPQQPRDNQGRWSSGGSSVGAIAKTIVSEGLADKANLEGLTVEEAQGVYEGLQSSLQAGEHKLKLRSIDVLEEDRGFAFGYTNGYVRISPTGIKQAREHNLQSVEAMFKDEPIGKRNFVGQASKDSQEYMRLSVAHEVGHHVDTALMFDPVKLPKNSPRLSENDILPLSGYATTHPVERFAELHAAVSTGRLDLVPSKLKQHYDDLLKTADPEPIAVFLRNK